MGFRSLLVAATVAVCGTVGNAADPPQPEVQVGHPKPPGHLAVSADGKTIVTTDGGVAIVWDAATGRREASAARIGGAAVSGDGERIVGATTRKLPSGDGFEHRLISLDLRSGRERTRSLGETSSKTAASRDGTRVVVLTGRPGGGTATATLWEPDSDAFRHLATEVTYRELAVSSDGKSVALRPKVKGPVTVLDTESGKELSSIDVPETCWGLVIGGNRLAAKVLLDKGFKTQLRVWDLATGKQIGTTDASEESYKPHHFSDDGKCLVALTAASTVTVWQVGDSVEILRTITVPTLAAIQLSPDGAELVVVTQADGKVVRFSTETGKRLGEFAATDGGVASAHFAAGDRVVLTSPTGAAVALSLRGDAGSVVRVPPKKRPEATGSYRPDDVSAVSRDGKTLAVATTGGTSVHHLTGNTPATRLGEKSDSSLPSVELSGDGKRLLAGRTAPTLWDVESGVAVRSFPRGFGHAAVSPTAKFVAGNTDQGTTVTVYDTTTGEAVKQLDVGHPVAATAFSPDETLLLVGAVIKYVARPDGKGLAPVKAGPTATLFNLATGKPVRTLGETRFPVTHVGFSKDGKAAFTSGGECRIWEVGTGKLIREIPLDWPSYRPLSLSGDGKFALLVEDASAALWDVAAGKLVWRAYLVGDGTDWVVLAPDGRYDGSAKGRERVLFHSSQGKLVADASRYEARLVGKLAGPAVGPRAAAAPLVRFVTPDCGGAVDRAAQTVVVEAEDKGGGVTGIALTLNGKAVAPEGPADAAGVTRRRKFAVVLAAGPNVLEATAKSTDGSPSEPATLSLRIGKGGSGGNLYLLAVGVSEYADKGMNLKYASADAEAVAKLFRDRGERGLFGTVAVRELTNRDATAANIKDALAEFAKLAKPDDTLIVHLSGHGVTLGQRYYFLPHEFRRDPETKEDDCVRRHGLPMDVLGPQVAGVKAGKRVLILDTCGSGGVATNVKGNLGVQKEFDALHEKASVFVLAAAPTDGVAQESTDLRHGVLTYTLLAGLGGVTHGPLRDKSAPAVTEAVGVIEWFNFAGSHFPKQMEVVTGQKQNAIVAMSGTSFPILPKSNR